jgi:hypothetical protein
MLKVIMRPTLGIDIGRVIIHGDGPDTSFIGATDEDALKAPPISGAFEAIGRLVPVFAGRVWLVSKCGPRIAERSLRWLDHHRFWEATDVPREQVRFCRQRKDKAAICLELGIGWFVDDRLDVLAAMEGVVSYRFLFGASYATAPSVYPAATWTAAEAGIRATRDEWEALYPSARPHCHSGRTSAPHGGDRPLARGG